MAWAGLRMSITLLTAVPLPGSPPDGQPDRRVTAAALYWAPFVGFTLGAAAAGVLVASRAGHAGPLLGGVLAIALLALLTRGLHLDGLADLADALGSRRPAAQALEIMKRPDIGPFGVVTLVLTLLVQVAALARADQLGRGPAAVITAAVAARLAVMLACRHGVPSARRDGLGALVAGTVHPLAGTLLAQAAVVAAVAVGWIYAAAMITSLMVSFALTALAVRRLGGITGDVLGALAETTMAVCLLVMAFS
jgi:adenosylcobinamide-GDP ribazoletransferase